MEDALQVELRRFEADSSLRFDRSHSFTAGGSFSAPEEWLDSSSDSDLEAATPTWVPGGTIFEPLEVEEGSTEAKYLRSALSKKERECEHLRCIIKELSTSRRAVQRTKVELEEQMGQLQKEFYRVAKVSELARTVSQQSVSRAARLADELSAARDQLRRAKRRAAAAEGRACTLAEENAALKSRLGLLEGRISSSSGSSSTSACAAAYLFSASVGLY